MTETGKTSFTLREIKYSAL